MRVAGVQRQPRFRNGSTMRPAVRLLPGLANKQAGRVHLVATHVFRKYGFESERTAPSSDLKFTDHAAIFEGRSSSDLLRALLVLRLCAVGPFVQHSEALLDGARRLLGDGKAMGLVHDSFYKHFCAGKEPADVWSRMNALRAHGIGAILDYAEEEDLLAHCKPGGKKDEPAAAAAAPAAAATASSRKSAAAVTARRPLGGESIIGSRVAARTYDHYGDEALAERHTAAFLAAIDTAATLPGQGFAAIKLTALGDPGLLEHLASAVAGLQALFRRYDLDGDGYVTHEEFDSCYEQLTEAAGGVSSADERSEVWRWLDTEGAGRVDYISWSQRLDLRNLPTMAAKMEQQAAAAGVCSLMVSWSRHDGPPYFRSGGSRPWELSDAEHRDLDTLLSRLERLVDRAVSKGVKLMIDAELSTLRPAIDHIAHDLMRRYNVDPEGGGPGEAVIFTSYQAYLRDCKPRLESDLARAQREGYTLGAKLVRGAYLHLERRRAAEAGLLSPVFDHIEDTHASFDACLGLLLGAVKAGRGEVMIGSHNQQSVEAAVALMGRLGLEPEEAPVYFGQLMGMADNLSFTLGHHGYKVFKYCPYGSVEKVIPYLLRRVNENQYILKGGKLDVDLLWAELWRRALHDPEHSSLARFLASHGASSSTRGTPPASA